MSAQNIGDPAVMQAIATLFGSLNGQQLASFIDQLNVATAQNNTTVEVAGPGVVNTPVGKNATSAPAVARGGNTGSRRKGAQGNGKLRALNSFMTFRSKFTFKALTTFLDKSAGYYSTLFAGQTQKVKSGLIRFLWAQDCLKSKWAMLAKAYSSVRDNHMGEVNLESFLRETTPLIVVIPAEDYLATMGWLLAKDVSGQWNLIRTQQGAITLADNFLTTNLSVEDIVEHCYTIGYVTKPKNGVRPSGAARRVRMSMAFAAQPIPMEVHASVNEKFQAQTEVGVGDVVDGEAGDKTVVGSTGNVSSLRSCSRHR